MHKNLTANGSLINAVQILIGFMVLLVGSLVYLVDRSPQHTYFVHIFSINIGLHDILPNFFGPIGNSLPAFVHVFSFILITAGLLSCRKRGCLIICAGWSVIDCMFELGQRFNSLPLKIIPDWFEGVPFLEASKNYFLLGTFDFIDLAAIATGTIIAYLVLLGTMERSNYENQKGK